MKEPLAYFDSCKSTHFQMMLAPLMTLKHLQMAVEILIFTCLEVFS